METGAGRTHSEDREETQELQHSPARPIVVGKTLLKTSVTKTHG